VPCPDGVLFLIPGAGDQLQAMQRWTQHPLAGQVEVLSAGAAAVWSCWPASRRCLPFSFLSRGQLAEWPTFGAVRSLTFRLYQLATVWPDLLLSHQSTGLPILVFSASQLRQGRQAAPAVAESRLECLAQPIEGCPAGGALVAAAESDLERHRSPSPGWSAVVLAHPAATRC